MNRSLVDLPLNWQAPHNIKAAIDTFIGYLLLDAWIGNSDRHHENWGFINFNGSYLAPTYNHASSLDRNESDDKRQARLKTNDRGFSVEAYVNKYKSCLHAQSGNNKPFKIFEAFYEAAKLCPELDLRTSTHLDIPNPHGNAGMSHLGNLHRFAFPADICSALD